MGGGHYKGDVAERQRSTNREVFTYQGYTGGDSEAAKRPERRECHPDLNIKGKNRECRDSTEHPKTTPMAIVMDITKSRSKDTKIIYGKLPMLIGQIIMKNYAKDPTICFGAFGDASSGDQAPIQVGQFESDNRLDEVLAKIWLEEGGGGTGKESAELIAYYFARHTLLDANKRGKKGILFILTDEGFYPKVYRDQIKVWIGDNVSEDIDSRQIFAELQQKYDVYVIYQKKKWEDRKADVDAEIKQRVKSAGGMYENVDVRASLLWNNRNDLDLHIEDPCGHHIFYGSYCKSWGRPPAPCGGFVDVDMNVKGETTKPVENIRWEQGKAPKGHYRVFVQNYAFHERNHDATEFRVEVQVGDKIHHFEGKTPAGREGPQSDTQVFEFDFEGRKDELTSKSDIYAAYDEKVIKRQWESVIPPDHVLDCEDPMGIVDIILGVLAPDLEQYIVDMEDRGQTPLRREQTRKSLTGLKGEKTDLVKVEIEKTPDTGDVKKKKGKTRRLNSL